jgi:hypothetical protein
VNGHHPLQVPYKDGVGEIPLTTQLEELNALAGPDRAIFYRNDISCQLLETPAQQNEMIEFVRQAAATNVTVLPILFPDMTKLKNSSDLVEVAEVAKASIVTCATVFDHAGGINVLEIGQEWDNDCILPVSMGSFVVVVVVVVVVVHMRLFVCVCVCACVCVCVCVWVGCVEGVVSSTSS